MNRWTLAALAVALFATPSIAEPPVGPTVQTKTLTWNVSDGTVVAGEKNGGWCNPDEGDTFGTTTLSDCRPPLGFYWLVHELGITITNNMTAGGERCRLCVHDNGSDVAALCVEFGFGVTIVGDRIKTADSDVDQKGEAVAAVSVTGVKISANDGDYTGVVLRDAAIGSCTSADGFSIHVTYDQIREEVP